MQLAKVTGVIVSTKKDERLVGYKLLVVRPQTGGSLEDVVAVDTVGAGIGETVLVVTGGGAREALGQKASPVDAAVVGIVDSWQAN